MWWKNSFSEKALIETGYNELKYIKKINISNIVN